MTISHAAGRRLQRVNLNLSYALNAILQAPTLTQAGQMIRLTQPAMSLALRKLRDHFDDELVVYHSGGRRLTELGEALAPQVAQLLGYAHNLYAFDLTFDPADSHRTVTIAAPEDVEIAFLTWLAPSLMAEAPNLRFRFVALRRVTGGMDPAIDIALVPDAARDPECRHTVLFGQGLACLVWEGHPTIGKSMSPAQYRSARHAALRLADDRTAIADGGTLPKSDDRRVTVWADRLSSLPLLIIGTDLVVTTTDWFAQYMAYLHPLRATSCPIDTAGSIHLQWQAHRDREPLIVWLRDRLAVGARQRWP